MTAASPGLRIEILAINQISDANSNDLIARTPNVIPWLQDTTEQAVWNRWAIVYRDVLILDPFNRPIGRYNLTANDLGSFTKREAFKQMLLDAAVVMDTDKDRLPDVWETFWFESLSPLPNGDDDGDGVDNWTEFTFSSHPRDPTSRPTLKPILARPGGKPALAVVFRRFGGSAAQVVVESSPDLVDWTTDRTSVFLFGSPVNLYDGTGGAQVRFQQTSAAGANPAGYLRVRAVTLPLPASTP